MDQNGFLLACNVWDRGTMPVLRGPDGGGKQFLQMIVGIFYHLLASVFFPQILLYCSVMKSEKGKKHQCNELYMRCQHLININIDSMLCSALCLMKANGG